MSRRIGYITQTLTIIFGLFVFSGTIFGQKPPRPITVLKTRDLAFGAFMLGPAGGLVSVDASSTRVASGDIVLLSISLPVTSSIFNISGSPGTLVTIMLGPDIPLVRGGGGSMNLHLDPVTIPVSPFVLTGGNPAVKDLYVGGTITVGPPAANPPGAYSGIFTIIFNQN